MRKSLTCLALVLGATSADAAPFVYAGRLVSESGAPIAGAANVRVRFFDAASGGSQLGAGPYDYPSVPLRDGAFELDLALAVPDLHAVFHAFGQPVWIEITDVARSHTYPRQKLSVVPYALKVPIDDGALRYDGDGLLTIGPSGAPGANQFLTRDGSGALVWATPSLGAAPVSTATPVDGQVLRYQGGSWQPVNDGSISKSGDTGVGSLALAEGATLGLGSYDDDAEAALLAGFGPTDAGKTWYNSDLDQIRYWNGTTAATLGVAGAGLASLNGLLGTSQSFAVGTSGAAPAWSSSGSTHTLNIPLASAAGVTAGLVSKSAYDQFSAKLDRAGDTMTGALRFREETVGEDNYVGFKAPASIPGAAGQGTLWTLPATDGTTGHVLTTNGSGVLSWAPVATASNVSGTVGVGNGGTGLTSLGSAHQILGVAPGGTALEYKSLVGTADRITVTAAAGSLTLSTPQAIATTSAPTFAGLTVSGTTSSLLATNGSGVVGAAGAAAVTGALGFTPVDKAGDTMTGPLALPSAGLTVGADQLAVTAAGVGIGTATPQGLLHLQSEATDGILRMSGAARQRIVLARGATHGTTLTTDANGDLRIAHADDLNERYMTFHNGSRNVDFNGNVGIGTATPASSLEIVRSQNGATSARIVNANTGSQARSAFSVGEDAANKSLNLMYLNESYGTIGSLRAASGQILAGNDATGGLHIGTGATAPITFGTGGFANEAMRIDADGNVGVGTTVPKHGVTYDAAARVVGIAGSGAATTASVGVLSLANNRATPAAGDNTGQIDFVSVNNAGNKQTAAIVGRSAGTGGANGFGGELRVLVKPDNVVALAEALRITSAGQVGIGTTSPTETLDVVGNIKASGTINGRIASSAGDSGTQSLAVGNSGTINVTGMASSTLNMNMGSSGGAGTINMNSQVGNGSNAYVRLGASHANGIVFGTANTPRMTIDSSGRVGIGTTAPAYNLDVVTDYLFGGSPRTASAQKGFRIGMPHYANDVNTLPFTLIFGDTSNGTNTVHVGGGTTGGYAATAIAFRTATDDTTISGSERMRITGDGNVGIGIGTPTSRLSVSDASATSTTGAAFTRSAATAAASTVYGIAARANSVNAVASGVTNSGYAMGLDGEGYLSGPGNMSQTYGLRTTSGTTTGGSGTVTDAYAIYSRVLNGGGGAITRGYGLFIQDVEATTGYGVFQAGANDVNYFNGAVGIGTTAPTSKLHVRDLQTNAPSYFASLVRPTFTSSTTGTYYNIAMQAYADKNVQAGVTDSGYVMGVDAVGASTSTGGTLTEAYGLRTFVGDYPGATGTITSAFGVRSRVFPQGSSTITNGYGLFLDDVTATNAFGIYQAGTNDVNYLAGSVGLGTLTPAKRLDVTGSAIAGLARSTTTAGVADYEGLFLRRRDNSGGTQGLFFNSNATGAEYWENLILQVEGGGSNLVFKTGSTAAERMRINTSGDVGIGMNPSNAKLHVSGQIVSALPTTLTPAATSQAINWATGNIQTVSLASATGTVVLSFSNAVAGGSYAIKFVQGATPRSVSWPAAVKWPSGAAFVPSTANGAVDLVTLFFDGTNYYAVGGKNFQ